MRKFLKRSSIIGVLILVVTGIISCEEDFTDIGTSIVSNTKFSTGEVILELEIKPINLDKIDADNIGLPILTNQTKVQADYWLGVYKNTNAKKVTAGFISQLSIPSNLKNSEDVVDGDTIYNLDKVVLKIPYTAVSLGKNTDGVTTYRLDSILGSPSVATSVEVYRNPLYLNTLNPVDPSKQNSFPSNFDYKETELLTESAGFSFKPLATDTIFEFDRIDRSVDVNSITIVKDTLKVVNTDNTSIPFLAIPLDLNKMKALFWDKFNDPEFSSSEEFQNYFNGIIIKASGNDGALVPLNISSIAQSSVDFLYSKTIIKNMVVDTVIKQDYSFSLSGIQNSIYKTENIISSPANSFVVQGTAGMSAEVKVLGVNLLNLDPKDPFLAYANKDDDNNNYLDLKEMASIKDVNNNKLGLLINDANLTFFVNSTLNSNSDVLPQRLYVYQNKDGVTPTHLSDSYRESGSYNGNLFIEENIPVSYSFKITDYISNLMDGSSNDFSPLVLKVFNTTDNPVITGSLNENVLSYNWNPRSVVLLDENDSQNGEKRAKLKISYSEKK